jgi:hypothetical protein
LGIYNLKAALILKSWKQSFQKLHIYRAEDVASWYSACLASTTQTHDLIFPIGSLELIKIRTKEKQPAKIIINKLVYNPLVQM